MSQVVCIHDDWFSYGGTGDRVPGMTPVLDQVYTIISHEILGDGEKYYRLYEMPSGLWWSGQFRPVKPTNISIFTGMLKTKSKELEDV